jgi:putative membrane protein
MKAADAVVNLTTGQYLSREQKEKAGPVVHYTFGGLMGALYGGAAEYWPSARAGFGTTFASALFTGADLIAVPALQLGPPADEQPGSAFATPFSAHLVYGVTTELVRRIVRSAM